MTNSTSDEREQRVANHMARLGAGLLLLKEKMDAPISRPLSYSDHVTFEFESEKYAIVPASLLDSEAARTTYLHHPQFPMNGTELECDGEELRPDGMCAKCERVNERIEAKIATIRQEERRAAFTAIGNEIRRYGANIRKVDLMTRFQELFREPEAAANETRPREDGEDGDDG